MSTRSEKEVAPSRGLDRAQALGIGLAAALLAAGIVGVNLYLASRLEGHVGGTPYADVFDRLNDPMDILFALGDGQAFVAEARDPTLSNLQAYRGFRGEAALRTGRPLQGYLGWVFSAGHPHWAEEGVLIATLLGCSVAAVGCGELLKRRGLNPWLGLIVLELPGSLASIRQFGPEMMGLGLVALALAAKKDHRVWVSVALFALSGLARETYLLVPLLFVWRDKRYLWPHAAWLAWTIIVRLRFGAWGPFVKLNGSRLLVGPFVGLAEALPRLGFPVVTALLIGAVPVLFFFTLRRRRTDELTPIVVVYGIFAIFLSPAIWNWWASFTRVLLPMTAFALIILMTPQDAGPPPVATE